MNQKIFDASPVGYVDFIYLIDRHPDVAKANEAMKAETLK
jgi:hypothetical protein